MRKANAYLLGMAMIGTSFLLAQSCTKSTSSTTLIGNWTTSYDFGGSARSEAVGFTIGDFSYIATGSTNRDRFGDILEFSLARQYWTQKSSMPTAAGVRNSAVAFTIKDSGYVATGYDGVKNLSDMWRFDTKNNNWVQKASLPGNGRIDAVAFTINDTGYICSGTDGNYLNDLWQYLPASDTWVQKASIGRKRSQAQAFVMNGVAYVCSGNNNGSALTDIWSYTPANDTWTEKKKIYNYSADSYDDNYTSIARFNGIFFIMDGKAYLTTGENGSISSTTWEYDIAADQWTEKTGFEGSPRTGAIGFALSNRGFVVTGNSGTQYYDNSFEFHPKDDKVDGD